MSLNVNDSQEGFPNIKFKISSISDKERINQFNHKYYYPHEPINIGSNFGEPTRDEETFVLNSINHGTSLIAYIENSQGQEEMIAIVLSEILTPPDLDEMIKEEKEIPGDNLNWKEMLNFFIWTNESSNLFNKMNVNQMLFVHTLAVHSDYRNRGLGKLMIKKQIEIAKELLLPALRLDCSNLYTAKMAESLGLQAYTWVPYTEIRNNDGFQIFHPPEPHKHFGTYAMYIK